MGFKLFRLDRTNYSERGWPHHVYMLEQRRIARTCIFAPAIVIPNRGSFVWDCLVRDITSLGARLEFPSAPVLPTDFDLTFDTARTLRACHLVWRIANEVGVTFQEIEATRRFFKPDRENPNQSGYKVTGGNSFRLD